MALNCLKGVTMAQFYASIQGNRGEATRVGTKSSGIVGHIRGWEVGARVYCSHENGHDVVRVYKTSGSTGREREKLIATFTDNEEF